VSQHFPDEDAAASYVLEHDDEAKQLEGCSLAYLAITEGRALRESGGRRIKVGHRSRYELTASILELRHPHIAEARAMLAPPEPGSEPVTFTFPGGVQATVPPTPEDPRVTAPLAMTDEAVLALVQEDSSSDYNEGVGEFGGYVSWNIKDGTLTVTVRAYTAQADDDPAGPLTRRWKLVRVDEPERRPS
jgi:hypothetical protein